jgi:hypothetical protein
MPSDDDQALLILEFDEDRLLAVLDLSAFLYDFNRLYVDTFRLALWTPEQPPPPIWGRYAYVLPNRSDRLSVHRIRFESPGLSELLGIASVLISAITLLLTASTWKLNREKTQLEVQKLRNELGVGRRFHRIEPTLHVPPSVRPAIDRLNESPLQPINIAFNIDIRGTGANPQAPEPPIYSP